MRRSRTVSLALPIALVAALAAGCASRRGLLLVSAGSGRALVDTEVVVFIDDGIRCVTEPCPTNARNWQGRTDAGGRLILPPLATGETATVYVEGFEPQTTPSGAGTLRLAPVVEPVPVQTLDLRARFADAGETLEIRVTNPGPDPLTLVRPRGGALETYAEWGGWHLLVRDAQTPFLPVPFPGAFVPPSPGDVVTLAPGQSLDARVRVGGWRRLREGTLLGEQQPLSEIEGRLTARVRWSGLPEHLRAGHGERAAPRGLASARTRRRAARD